VGGERGAAKDGTPAPVTDAVETETGHTYHVESDASGQVAAGDEARH
jgi:hypothetical protein